MPPEPRLDEVAALVRGGASREEILDLLCDGGMTRGDAMGLLEDLEGDPRMPSYLAEADRSPATDLAVAAETRRVCGACGGAMSLDEAVEHRERVTIAGILPVATVAEGMTFAYRCQQCGQRVELLGVGRRRLFRGMAAVGAGLAFGAGMGIGFLSTRSHADPVALGACLLLLGVGLFAMLRWGVPLDRDRRLRRRNPEVRGEPPS